MKLLIESHVPYIPEELKNLFDVEVVAPEQFTPERVANCNAMIVRTRTRCNESLLGDSMVEFVATATIGTDHIDIPWCESRGIEVASAPGCNAPAVAQYVFASLLKLFPMGLEGKMLGVVGVGHVGSIVADWGEQLGMRVLRCDPPRADKEGVEGFVDIDEIAAQADVVTFHVPHTRDGKYATHHLAGTGFFSRLQRRPVIINAARGPIVDTPALVDAVDRQLVGPVVIDTWEGEPQIDPSLLQRSAIATPHIAGYSREGKIRATAAAVNALCRHFGMDYRFDPGVAFLPDHVDAEAIAASYDPMRDDAALRSNPSAFEHLRNSYALRAEV